MSRREADGGSDAFDHHLRDLFDDEQRADAVRNRRREHGLRRQAEEAGQLAGVLLDLGEREQLVVVATSAGRNLRGVVRTVGGDFIGLRSPAGDGALVPLSAIAAVRTEPGAERTVGDRVVRMDGSLVAVLTDLAAGRPFVAIHTADGRRIAGELRSTGHDVLTLELPDGGGSIYVAISAICDLALP